MPAVRTVTRARDGRFTTVMRRLPRRVSTCSAAKEGFKRASSTFEVTALRPGGGGENGGAGRLRPGAVVEPGGHPHADRAEPLGSIVQCCRCHLKQRSAARPLEQNRLKRQEDRGLSLRISLRPPADATARAVAGAVGLRSEDDCGHGHMASHDPAAQGRGGAQGPDAPPLVQGSQTVHLGAVDARDSERPAEMVGTVILRNLDCQGYKRAAEPNDRLWIVEADAVSCTHAPFQRGQRHHDRVSPAHAREGVGRHEGTARFWQLI